MKEIISCSRKTDVPAFYYNWLQKVLKNKSVTQVNQYNNKEYIVDLSPENVHSIVLWSKNYANVIEDPRFLKNYNLYFQFTITGYNKVLEPNVIDYKEAVKQVEILSNMYSPNQINWRFDPIIIADGIEIEPNNRINMFDNLCRDLSSVGINRCTTSFITLYSNVSKRLKNSGIKCNELSNKNKICLIESMIDIADKYNIKLYSCSNKILESVNGIYKSSCIDGNYLSDLFNVKASKAKDQGQRKACGCTKSRDIGNYLSMPCIHNCRYCYANPEK